MTTIADIMQTLNEFAPPETAQKWDNCGLLVGSPVTEVTKALVTLDITLTAVAEARRIGAQLIVSHHPVIFRPLSVLKSGEPVYELAAAGIAAVAAHTNLDICDGGVGSCLAAALGLTNVRDTAEPFVKVGDLPAAMTPEQFAKHTAACLKTAVRLHSGNAPIQTVAVGGGSCGEFARVAEAAGAEAFVSGEIRHHEYINEPMTLIEAGHYATEQPVIPSLCARLAAQHPSIEWHAFDIGEPYTTVM
ncbi:MAG: Nif3-like dinuclear metal center hexameric protein [Clostridia bacterium]|nr:Nif3-like dinuclear metal center hexameric protein [Clostridia bacterium]